MSLNPKSPSSGSSGIFSVLTWSSSLSFPVTQCCHNSRHHVTILVWKIGFFSIHLFSSQRSISQNVPANSPLHHVAKISWTTNRITNLWAKKILGIRRILTNHFPERLYPLLLSAPVYPTFIGLILRKKMIPWFVVFFREAISFLLRL